MKINLQNYEQYFIDYLDGNLNPAEEAELRNFVRLHPDLQAEFEDLNDFVLIPENIEYQNKNLLKEDELKAIEGIGKTERLSIAFLENDISNDEQIELNQLKNKAKNKSTFELIQKTKISPEKIVFKNKSALKKKTPVVFLFQNQSWYKIAAAVLLFISFTFYFKRENSKVYNDVALIPLKEIPLRKVQTIEPIEQTIEIKQETILWTAFSPKPIKEQQIENTLPNEKPFNAHPVKAKNIHLETENDVHILLAQNNIQKQKIKIKKEVPERIKEPLKRKMVWALKKAGKTIWYKVTYSLRKNIKYKKEYLDDDKVLIAFKAGNYEYKKIKDVKKQGNRF